MQSPSANLFTRPDTFFGVCEALGEDLRIHANIFRMAFAALLFWSPVTGFASYAALGALIASSRWLFPSPAVTPAAAEAEEQPEQLPIAA